MAKIELYDPSGRSRAVVEFHGYLKDHGLEPELALGMLGMHRPIATVAFLDRWSMRACFALGTRTGEQVPLIIVAKQPVEFPELSQVVRLEADDPNLFRRLYAALIQAVGPGGERPELPRSGEELLGWLREDWARLDLLDSANLVDLMDVVLRRSGFTTTRGDAPRDTDLLVKEPRANVRWFVDCKVHHWKSLFDLGDIRRACDSWAAREADFGMIVTNTKFTRAARAWASQAVPAVHLVDQNTLRAALMMLDPPTVKGHLGRLLDTFAREPLIDQEAVRGEPPKWSDKVCLVLGEQRSEDRARELMTAMHRHFATTSVSLLSSGPAAPNEDWRRTLAEAAIVVFVPSSEHSRPLWRDRNLQVLGHLCRPQMGPKVFVLFAEDSPLNRLSVPTCMSDLIFVDSTHSMIASVRSRLDQSEEGPPEDSESAGSG